jgi:hypothetical protein
MRSSPTSPGVAEPRRCAAAHDHRQPLTARTKNRAQRSSRVLPLALGIVLPGPPAPPHVRLRPVGYYASAVPSRRGRLGAGRETTSRPTRCCSRHRGGGARGAAAALEPSARRRPEPRARAEPRLIHRFTDDQGAARAPPASTSSRGAQPGFRARVRGRQLRMDNWRGAAVHWLRLAVPGRRPSSTFWQARCALPRRVGRRTRSRPRSGTAARWRSGASLAPLAQRDATRACVAAGRARAPPKPDPRHRAAIKATRPRAEPRRRPSMAREAWAEGDDERRCPPLQEVVGGAPWAPRRSR